MTPTLENNRLQTSQNLSTPAQYGGRRMQRTLKMRKTMRRHNITGTYGRGTFVRNWHKIQPGTHERTLMLKRCGKKCFLGPNKTFPICARRTCKRNRKGVYAAYMRAEEYKTIKGSDKYRRISAKARKMLY